MNVASNMVDALQHVSWPRNGQTALPAACLGGVLAPGICYRGIPVFLFDLHIVQIGCSAQCVNTVCTVDVAGFLLHGNRTTVNPSSMQHLHASNMGQDELTSGSVHENLPSKNLARAGV